MKRLPKTEQPLVLRTDFTDQAAWEAIRATVEQPVGEFLAYVEFLDDKQYAGADKEQLLGLLPENNDTAILVVVDHTAISDPDHPLLIVDLEEERGREFRAIPSQLQNIENYLSISNMDFDEFADAIDENGVFRGFPDV